MSSEKASEKNMEKNLHVHSCPAKTGFGFKALDHLPGDLVSLGRSRPLIIAGKDVGKSGRLKNVVRAFKGSGIPIGVYDGIRGSSDMETVRELRDLYRNKGYDSIVAVGGNVVADIAKILNLVVSGQVENLTHCEGVDKIPGPLGPWAMVADSSVSGLETSHEARIGDHFFRSEFLMPDLVILDPRMMSRQPGDMVLNSGLTALCCAFEALALPTVSPLSQATARIVVSQVAGNLKNAFLNETGRGNFFKEKINDRREAHQRMELAGAALLAGTVVANTRGGLLRKLAHETARESGELPGLVMGILLPGILEYQARVAGVNLESLLLPLAGLENYASTPEGVRLESTLFHLRELMNLFYKKTAGLIPRTLGEAGVSRERLGALADSVAGGNPVSYDREACLMILECAYFGKTLIPVSR